MNKRIGIIGYGKLGSTLAEYFNSKGNLLWIVENDKKARMIAKEKINSIPILNSILDITEIPDYIFITVYDNKIEDVAIQLAEYLKQKLEGVYVIHCSGALTTEILSSCKEYGAKTASLHPYQTFYYPSVDLLKGIGWSIQTDEYPDELISLIETLGGNANVIPNNDKITSLYHASAVIASNFLNTLISLSKETAALSGIDPDKFIEPIVRTTIENNLKKQHGDDFPLTGPFARGDIETINNHLNALKEHPHLLKSYCYFGLATIAKINKENLADKKIINNIEELLNKYF
jgi:predicted short-subunit dehydrogenase-like oxidoreductase (DUF2520 family)